MTDAPEKIRASLTAVRDGWYQVVNTRGGQRAFPPTEYTRTDIAQARIEELEAALSGVVNSFDNRMLGMNKAKARALAALNLQPED